MILTMLCIFAVFFALLTIFGIRFIIQCFNTGNKAVYWLTFPASLLVLMFLGLTLVCVRKIVIYV